QVVDVEFLDVEGLERARAAGAQELGHLRLVLVAVEPGLERVRRGDDLTKRQGGGKDFDQERFHRTLRKLETLRETLAAQDLGRDGAGGGIGGTKRAFWRVLFPRRENLLLPLRTGRRHFPIRPTDRIASAAARKYPLEILLKFPPNGDRGQDRRRRLN